MFCSLFTPLLLAFHSDKMTKIVEVKNSWENKSMITTGPAYSSSKDLRRNQQTFGELRYSFRVLRPWYYVMVLP